MTRCGHVAWRMAAVVAFAGTAILAVMSTRVPAGTRTAPSSKVACPVSGLQAWLGLGAGTGSASGSAQATDGGTYFTLEFTNVSHRTCSLYGYPQVSAYAASEVTGSFATPDATVRPQPVTLPPGATAHAVLQVMGTGSTQPASCAQIIAHEIRVIPPDHGRFRGGATVFAVQIPVCAVGGHTSLSVQAVRARAGIPGHPLP
jgi:hypothetical protein